MVHLDFENLRIGDDARERAGRFSDYARMPKQGGRVEIRGWNP